MGWSHDAGAGDVLDKICDACRTQTGSMNVWSANGERYMFETACKTHDDYRITGSVWRYVANGQIVRSGSFCIKSASDYRMPASLRKLASL